MLVISVLVRIRTGESEKLGLEISAANLTKIFSSTTPWSSPKVL